MDATPKPVMTLDEIHAFFDHSFPQIGMSKEFSIEDVGPMRARMRLMYSERLLREGGTISGPSMFALADVGLYVAILAQIGPVTQVVTINLNINFLRRPPARDMLVECKLLRVGKRIAVGEAILFSEGDPEPVAHAIGSYALPTRVAG